VTDTQALLPLMCQAWVVLNASGPFTRYGVALVRAAIAAGVDLRMSMTKSSPYRRSLAAATLTRQRRPQGLP
jgi:hypothetical protein